MKFLFGIISVQLMLSPHSHGDPIIISSEIITTKIAADSAAAAAASAAANSAAQAGANAPFFEKFKAECAGAPISCILMGLTGAQIIASLAAGNSAQKTKAGFQASGGSGFSNESPATNFDWGEYGSEAGFKTAVNDGLKDLAKKGYKVDPLKGTLTDPKGKTHKMASLTSGKAMADSGLINPEDIATVDQEIKNMKDKAKVISMGIAAGGGGGGGASAAAKSYTYEDPYAALYGNMNKEQPNAPKTEGLTRTLASGESIGSRTDNLFEMIHRKYQDKNEDTDFFVRDTVKPARP